jgi:hypothetical protein
MGTSEGIEIGPGIIGPRKRRWQVEYGPRVRNMEADGWEVDGNWLFFYVKEDEIKPGEFFPTSRRKIIGAVQGASAIFERTENE